MEPKWYSAVVDHDGLLTTSGATDAQQLVRDEGVDTVLLTGGTETARAMLDNKPTLRLLAETTRLIGASKPRTSRRYELTVGLVKAVSAAACANMPEMNCRANSERSA